MSRQSLWRRVGVNHLRQTVEENNEGVRRVLTPSGNLVETPRGRSSENTDTQTAREPLLFARMTAPEDAAVLAQCWKDPCFRSAFENNEEKLVAVWSTPCGKTVPPRASTSEVKAFRALVSRQKTVPQIGHKPPENTSITPSKGTMFQRFEAVDKALSKSGNDRKTSAEISSQEKTSPKKDTSDVAVFDIPESSDLPDTAYCAFSDTEHAVTGYASPSLIKAMRVARPKCSAMEVRHDLLKAIGCSMEHLEKALSPDQMDAVWLALERCHKGRSFLLGDETGYGKGRVLAALAMSAIQNGHRVVFFTEKTHLLSDFLRDVLAVAETDIALPAVIHKTAKVRKPDGSVVISPRDNRLPLPDDLWTWTTYAQFNRPKKDKLQALRQWMTEKPTLLLLDEAQNAAGDSRQGKSLQSLRKAASCVVFSSATPIKNENQLGAYRDLIDVPQLYWSRLVSSFGPHSGTLRKALTISWAEQGAYVRREHPPMSFPDPLWVPRTKEVVRHEEALRRWALAWLNAVEVWKKAAGLSFSPWQVLGGPFSRAMREAGLWLRMDALRDDIMAARERNEKVVVVADWSLSSHVAKWAQSIKEAKKEDASRVPRFDMDEGERDDDGATIKLPKGGLKLERQPMWADAWCRVLEDMMPEEWLATRPPVLANPCRQAKQLVVEELKKGFAWPLSPFDTLTRDLEASGLRVLELSGRPWSVKHDDSTWMLAPRPKTPRSTIVDTFNNEPVDVILVTRAGNAGISLHAGSTFKDQRPRRLIEWDVAADPSVRLQFWGRVRRKDQVCEATRATLLIDTPSERRRTERDRQKHAKLTAHGGRTDSPVYTQAKERARRVVVDEWMDGCPLARQLTRVGRGTPPDNALARAFVLPRADREALMAFDDSVEAYSPCTPWMFEGPSRVVRKAWWWGTGDCELTWEERVWGAQPAARMPDIMAALRAEGAARPDVSLVNVVAQWHKQWEAWWCADPRQETPARRRLLSMWETRAKGFDRAQAVKVRDPRTGALVYAVVIGVKPPDTDDPRAWSASQIGLTLWLATHSSPLTFSLTAWAHPALCAAQPAGAPKAEWFERPDWHPHARVLVGRPWASAAWGVRQYPEGRLSSLHDGRWGWIMPSAWSWEDMLRCQRDLMSVDQALLFYKNHADPITWSWSADEKLAAFAQEDGLFIKGYAPGWEKIAFPVMRVMKKVRRPQRGYTGHAPQTGSGVLPWAYVPRTLHQWWAAGAFPSVGSEHAEWVARHARG